ncbi:unnamed protein product [Durusdinium trenchii]|uniref:Uncharacterized protein n=1 Tax=Durusdinium trenchii TaxID=1381693 RepID=A0ABP0IC81_9DINO
MANFPHVLSTSAPSLTTSKMRHASQNKPSASEEELKMELSKLPPLNVETLTRVLRTLLLWTSWIHEDVGHAWASFIYNPVHTPGFVPVDGKGICSPALIYRVAMFRNFVALERNKLTDPIDEMMFSKMICPQGEAATSSDDANPWTSCVEQVNGIVVNAFAQFRRSLDNLDTKEIFTEFAQNGFYSRTRSVESSASS